MFADGVRDPRCNRTTKGSIRLRVQAPRRDDGVEENKALVKSHWWAEAVGLHGTVSQVNVQVA